MFLAAASGARSPGWSEIASIARPAPAPNGATPRLVLQRMVAEAAVQRPGQLAVLSRMTEVLFVEVLRSWIKSLGLGEGGWLGAIG